MICGSRIIDCGDPSDAVSRTIALGFLLLLASACEMPHKHKAPYPESSLTVSFDYDTYRREAEGSDNWPLTWAAEGQYTSWGDGGSFAGDNVQCRVSLGFARIFGSAEDFDVRDLVGDQECGAQLPAGPPGKSYGLLDVEDRLYMARLPGSSETNLTSSTLYVSSDGLATPFRETAPAIRWTARDGLGMVTFLQFGRRYTDTRDDFVYLYALNISDTSTFAPQIPGEVVLMRVPKDSMEIADAYQYVVGLEEGTPHWGGRDDREPVFTDANGAFISSVVYSPTIGRYLLFTSHGDFGEGHVGLFEAPQPWGPWRTVWYEGAWKGDRQFPATIFFGNFSQSWSWQSDGDFVFVFTGTGAADGWNQLSGTIFTAVP